MHLYYFVLYVVYFYSEKPLLLQRSVARDLGGVSHIYIYIYIYICFTTRMVLDYAASTAMILKPLGTIVINIVHFKTFCGIRCTKRADRLVVNEWELWLLYYCL